jgi:hypothetical protein
MSLPRYYAGVGVDRDWRNYVVGIFNGSQHHHDTLKQHHGQSD